MDLTQREHLENAPLTDRYLQMGWTDVEDTPVIQLCCLLC